MYRNGFVVGILLSLSFGSTIAPDKDSRQMGIYPPLFGLIGYFKFQIGYFKFLYWVSI